ncbi:hypothetical protein [Sphingomonas psychrolutea]|nr:hypothetical protein [Sphingomonas psychrolutea]
MALAMGGAAERTAALLQLIALVVSRVLGWLSPNNYGAVLIQLWAVDTGLLIALYVLAFRANRFWPLWLVGLQTQSVIVHLLKLIDLHLLPVGYFAVVNLTAWPMITLTAIASVRHRHRLKRYGIDPSFRPYSQV